MSVFDYITKDQYYEIVGWENGFLSEKVKCKVYSMERITLIIWFIVKNTNSIFRFHLIFNCNLDIFLKLKRAD